MKSLKILNLFLLVSLFLFSCNAAVIPLPKELLLKVDNCEEVLTKTEQVVLENFVLVENNTPGVLSYEVKIIQSDCKDNVARVILHVTLVLEAPELGLLFEGKDVKYVEGKFLVEIFAKFEGEDLVLEPRNQYMIDLQPVEVE